MACTAKRRNIKAANGCMTFQMIPTCDWLAGLASGNQSHYPVVVGSGGAAAVAVGDREVDIAVGALLDFSDTAVGVLEEVLLVDDLAAIEDDADDPLAGETAEEKIPV